MLSVDTSDEGLIKGTFRVEEEDPSRGKMH